MKVLAVLAVVIAMLAASAVPARAESGYASPEFQMNGMSCIDTSAQPNLHDRTADTFACVGPVGTTTASGDLVQVIYVRYKRYYSWGHVDWHCAAVQGPYNRYARQFTNLACSG